MNLIASAVAPEIIACVGAGRDPTVQELGRLAQRIRAEVYRASAFAWGDDAEPLARVMSYRYAQIALSGSIYGECMVVEEPAIGSATIVEGQGLRVS